MKFIKLDEVNSTNNYLKENIKEFSNYDIVSAKIQTSGRGRRGNTWTSSEGMALFSFLLKTEGMKIEDYTKLPLIAGIATLSALNKIQENDYKFKWTNDIYLKNKKICGILIEKVDDDFVVGIGININNEIPKQIRDIAIALGKNFEINQIILKVVEEFSNYYDKFISGNWEEILEEINSYNLLRDKKIKLSSGNSIFEGTAKNINLAGSLEVEIENEIKTFNAGEIKIEKGFI